MKSGKAILGALAGLAAGAVLGILFAPDKGTKTRKKIAQKSGDYVDELGDKFNELVNTMSQKIDTLKEEVSTMAENGKAQADAAINKVANAVKSKMSEEN